MVWIICHGLQLIVILKTSKILIKKKNCSNIVTACIMSEYHIVTHADAYFDPTFIHIEML